MNGVTGVGGGIEALDSSLRSECAQNDEGVTLRMTFTRVDDWRDGRIPAFAGMTQWVGLMIRVDWRE